MVTERELKLQILRYISKQSDHVYKFNLIGRDHWPGNLELELRERWSAEQRLEAAYAFDGLKSQRMLRPTLSTNPDPDNWVVITPAGIEALETGVIDENAPQPLVPHGDVLDDLRSELKQYHPTAVIFADLDNFKTVNDTLGHDAGDSCIEKFKELLSAIVAGRGRAHRRYVTGDEFVVILPNCTREEARPIAERIRCTVESANIGESVPVTVSLGVCALESDSRVTDATELMNLADKAMYEAKQKKNAVAVLDNLGNSRPSHA